MVNEKRTAAKEIFQVSHCDARIQKNKKTINAHNVSPAYVEMKTGSGTSCDRERSPHNIVSSAKPTYNRGFRLIFILLSVGGLLSYSFALYFIRISAVFACLASKALNNAVSHSLSLAFMSAPSCKRIFTTSA